MNGFRASRRTLAATAAATLVVVFGFSTPATSAPMYETDVYYFSDATHTVLVGEKNVRCYNPYVTMWGTVTPFAVSGDQQLCP